ncbi:MAG: hypothetical protein ACFFDC_10250 [Promethearchaeota archaeon]
MNQKIIRSLLLVGIISISAYIGVTFAAKVITPSYNAGVDLISNPKSHNQEEECCGHVDVVPPSITLISPLNNSIVAGGTIIDLYITDADSTVTQVLYHWEDDSSNVTLDYLHEITLMNESGIHVLSVYAEDSAENWISAIFVFTVLSLQTTTTETTTTQQITISESTPGFEWVILIFAFYMISISFISSKRRR